MQHEQQAPSFQQKFKATVGWSSFIAQILAVSVQPMLRTTFGERYFGVEGNLVLLAVPLFSLFWREHDTTWLWWFLFAYIFTCAIAKKHIRVRAKSGTAQHSFYGGYPIFCRIWPFKCLRESTVKGTLEPLVVAGAAVAFLTVNVPLGTYLLWAAASLRLTQKLADGYRRTRDLDLRDAYLEQQNAAERFRGGGWQ
jgi:hypothetical protein